MDVQNENSVGCLASKTDLKLEFNISTVKKPKVVSLMFSKVDFLVIWVDYRIPYLLMILKKFYPRYF